MDTGQKIETVTAHHLQKLCFIKFSSYKNLSILYHFLRSGASDDNKITSKQAKSFRQWGSKQSRWPHHLLQGQGL
jgi:hypothetical protein